MGFVTPLGWRRPRLSAPRIEKRDWEEEEEDESALNVAIRFGRLEIVKKIGLDPCRDDATRLLNQYFVQAKPEIIDLLVNAGADVTAVNSDVIDSVFCSFRWGLETGFMGNPVRTEEALRCIEILGSHGVCWSSPDKYRLLRLRRTLARIRPNEAIRYLQRIANSKIMEQAVFKELMRTPRMQEILKQPYPGCHPASAPCWPTDELRASRTCSTPSQLVDFGWTRLTKLLTAQRTLWALKSVLAKSGVWVRLPPSAPRKY